VGCIFSSVGLITTRESPYAIYLLHLVSVKYFSLLAKLHITTLGQLRQRRYVMLMLFNGK
jgi:hypothetical protein